jgi:hypothetical protein
MHHRSLAFALFTFVGALAFTRAAAAQQSLTAPKGTESVSKICVVDLSATVVKDGSELTSKVSESLANLGCKAGDVVVAASPPRGSLQRNFSTLVCDYKYQILVGPTPDVISCVYQGAVRRQAVAAN